MQFTEVLQKTKKGINFYIILAISEKNNQTNTIKLRPVSWVLIIWQGRAGLLSQLTFITFAES